MFAASALTVLAAGAWAQRDSGDTINSIKGKPKKATAKTTHSRSEKRAGSRASVASAGKHGGAARTHPVASKPPAVPVIVVSKLGGGRYKTIGEAVRAAKPGTRILVRAGLYPETVTLDKPLEIVADASGGAGDVILEAPAPPCLILTAPQALVRGLTVRTRLDSAGRAGTAVLVPVGHTILEDCDIASSGKSCVGVLGARASPLLRRCRIQAGGAFGVLVEQGGNASLEGCNVLGGEQGVVADASAVAVQGGQVRGVTYNGIWVTNGGSGTVADCTITKSGASGLWANKASRLVARRCHISESVMYHGIAVVDKSRAEVEDCEVRASRENGVLVIDSRLAIRRTLVHEATSGIVYTDGATGSAEGCEVYAMKGSGFYVVHGSSLDIRGCKAHDCGWDCAQYNDAGGTLVDSEFYGGADCNVSTNHSDPTIRHCRVHDSRRMGIWALFGSRATIEDCDVTGSRYSGIAIETGHAAVINCRITGNGAAAIWATAQSEGAVENCALLPNGQGATHIETGCRFRLQGNGA